ncbi:MAG: HAD-IA family hydrolase [bacterium]|nr:HAD-IA family hydrolase [bacterium]
MAHGLIFDMDGVLADTETLIARATIDMYRELYDVELTAEDFRPFIGTGAVRYTEGPAEKMGIEIDLDRAVQRRHERFVTMLEAGECKPCPGALELIDAAHQAGWRLAVATSSPQKKAELTWDAIGLPLDKFDALITGDMAAQKKPHPEIYLKAIDAVALPPTSCVVVEDAISGVTAAKAAGTYCIGVTSSFDAAQLAEADWVVDSLEAVTPDALASRLS